MSRGFLWERIGHICGAAGFYDFLYSAFAAILFVLFLCIGYRFQVVLAVFGSLGLGKQRYGTRWSQS